MKAKIRKNKLRHYRRLLDWTQTELAEAVGLERGSGQIYISRGERGTRKISEHLRVKISATLGLPRETIFPEDTGLPLRGVLDEKTNRPD